MTSLQERSSDSLMTNDERDEVVLELSRSLWSLHMAGYHFEKMVEENKSLNLASAPRSTEITLSHGHATSKEETNGTVVPNTEVGLAEGQYRLSIEDTYVDEIEHGDYETGLNDPIGNEMLKSILMCSMPMGNLDVLDQDDSSDLGSKEQGAFGLRDGDLASADLQPGHPIINKEDRRMMMNGHGSEHVQNTCRTRWGSSPDVGFFGEPRMGRRLREAVPSA